MARRMRRVFSMGGIIAGNAARASLSD